MGVDVEKLLEGAEAADRSGGLDKINVTIITAKTAYVNENDVFLNR